MACGARVGGCQFAGGEIGRFVTLQREPGVVFAHVDAHALGLVLVLIPSLEGETDMREAPVQCVGVRPCVDPIGQARAVLCLLGVRRAYKQLAIVAPNTRLAFDERAGGDVQVLRRFIVCAPLLPPPMSCRQRRGPKLP